MNGGLTRRLTDSERLARLTSVVGKSDAKGGKEASAVGAFIAGGERGSWQQAHTSASTADVEAVWWQQR
jgi:hypothetical protein